MSNHDQTTQPGGFKDRKTGLVAMGIIQILIGAFCGLMVPLAILGMIVSMMDENSANLAMNPGQMIPGILFYVFLAGWFIWMGIGSIRNLRWARALTLVVSWIWLIGGIGGLIIMTTQMSGYYDNMMDSGASESVILFAKVIMVLLMTFIYVIMPGGFVLFYKSPDVKATCEFRDPEIRWTDKCPLPVLAISLIFGLTAFSTLFMGFYGWVVPLFGNIVSGAPGALIALAGLALCLYIARGAYQLNIKAWWCALLLSVVWGVSAVITFASIDIRELYEKMNYSEQQLQMMEQYGGLWQGSGMSVFLGFWAAGFIGYLLYTRKYFSSDPAGGITS